MEEVAIACGGGNVRTSASGTTPLDSMGNDCICFGQRRTRGGVHHLYGCVCEINKRRLDLAIFAGHVQLGGIPDGQHRANELGKALLPSSIGSLGAASQVSRC